VAALAVSIAYVVFVARRGEERQDELGRDGFEALSPAGKVERVERFSWRYGKMAAWFTVGIYALDGTPIDVDPSRRLLAPEWVPPPATLAELPAEFIWRVQAHDGSTTSIGQDEARVSLR
jgi:hypothetical protein